MQFLFYSTGTYLITLGGVCSEQIRKSHTVHFCAGLSNIPARLTLLFRVVLYDTARVSRDLQLRKFSTAPRSAGNAYIITEQNINLKTRYSDTSVIIFQMRFWNKTYLFLNNITRTCRNSHSSYTASTRQLLRLQFYTKSECSRLFTYSQFDSLWYSRFCVIRLVSCLKVFHSRRVPGRNVVVQNHKHITLCNARMRHDNYYNGFLA